MASITFAQRIQDDLQVLIASNTLIDLTNQRDSDATEDTDISLRASQFAAAKIESILGSAGTYDDTDQTIGDQVMLDLGVRLAYERLRRMTGVWDTEDEDVEKQIVEEAKDLNETRVQENALPVRKSKDNEELNKRYKSSEWPDDSDTDGSQD